MSYEEFLKMLRSGGLTEPTRFLHMLQHGLRDVYLFNQNRFTPERGDDQGLFGFQVYKNGWFRIEQDLFAYGNGVKTDRPKNSLTVYAAGRNIKVYRGGPDENYDIHSFDIRSGSETRVDLARTNSRQLSLFEQFDPEADHSSELSELVLVHAGNSDLGLTNLWIGAPRFPTLENLSAWAFVVHLPDICAEIDCPGSGQTVSMSPKPTAPHNPSHDEIAEPELKIVLRSEVNPDASASADGQ